MGKIIEDFNYETTKGKNQVLFTGMSLEGPL